MILGALSPGDGRKLFKASAAKRPIPSLLPFQNHYLKSYNFNELTKHLNARSLNRVVLLSQS
jgi:hypothetical protein